jgi:hypothetical protein
MNDIQSARLWYECIKGVLVEDGFEEIEPCIFKREIGVVILYVDDLLVLGEEKLLAHIKDLMVKRFGEITEEKGDNISYLGMNIR